MTLNDCLKEIKPPYPGIELALVEENNMPGMYWLTVYEANLEAFKEQQQLEVMNWLTKLADFINDKGYFCGIHLEKA